MYVYLRDTLFLVGTFIVYSHTSVVVVLDSKMSSKVVSASSIHKSGRVLKSDTAEDY